MRFSSLLLSYVNVTHSLFSFPQNHFVSPLVSANNRRLCRHSSQSPPFIHLSITWSSSPLHASSPLLVTVVSSQSFQIRQSSSFQTVVSSSIPDCVDKWVNNIHEQNVHHEKESIANSGPHLGMKFESEAAAYEFYNDYNKRIGFGIRRVL